MMSRLREKIFSLTSSRAKLQILTLCPSNWTVKQCAEYFKVSEYLVRTARKLANEKGILSLPDPKMGRGLSQVTRDLVLQFYHDEEHTREMSKDFVSIGRNIHKQKRLILCNLKELFSSLREKFPEVKIGFSKFCSLRPKWCILPGAAGTHSVCVCIIHQNAKLLLSPIGANYKELTKFLVCDIDNKECMVQHCPNCPKSTEIFQHKLYEILENEGYAEDDTIEFQQWTNTDRATMVRQTEYVYNYVDIVETQLQKLTSHSFIAKAQSRYLKSRKADMDSSTALILGDFAENYKFMVQDEVQGFHWNNCSCTLHPVVVYYKEGSELQHMSFCIITDDLSHDVPTVYEVQRAVLNFIKRKIVHLTSVEYFSDRCSGQYKNRKNFLNLCYQEQDHSLKASWTFFATSHGKQPCDGIGGTVKRLVSRESLKRVFDKQILSTSAMFSYCKENIKEIIFFFITKEQISVTRNALNKRFEGTVPVPGTRSFHQFYHIGGTKLAVKRCSEDQTYVLQHDVLGQTNIAMLDFEIFQYVACMYEGKWYVGIVMEVNQELNDIYVKFMHPSGPARSFNWPNVEDCNWIPMVHVLCKIGVPTTVNGRQYNLEKKDVSNIAKLFTTFQN
ncbi:LOW QUALITY PROTEIN: uncharacterized protein LOC134779822 [Penaeus indicus]|uniref:LOW QUALITY PROTEIN: uncharacterized protein LOC134779822 n=1 Tax=Penaeus indicus TaxID=29960 RepID=UPI00300C3A8A